MALQDPFWWGAAGGFAGAVALFVLPGYAQAVLIKRSWVEAAGGIARIIEAVVLAIIYGAIGGLLVFIPGSVTRGGAILIGLAVQTSLKSLMAAGKEVLKAEVKL
ncbi:MAG TPA: hypothetical protein VG246_11830 [Acidimicrobiales bacterium]|nr:hypothetical protein [Acidimicrobiales bacterium]